MDNLAVTLSCGPSELVAFEEDCLFRIPIMLDDVECGEVFFSLSEVGESRDWQ